MPWTLNLYGRLGTLAVEAQIDFERRTADVRLQSVEAGREPAAPPWPLPDHEEIYSRAG